MSVDVNKQTFDIFDLLLVETWKSRPRSSFPHAVVKNPLLHDRRVIAFSTEYWVCEPTELQQRALVQLSLELFIRDVAYYLLICIQGIHKRMVRFPKLTRNLFLTLHGHNVHRQQRQLSKFLMPYQLFAVHAYCGATGPVSNMASQQDKAIGRAATGDNHLLPWPPRSPDLTQIGRASCRERVCDSG
jgi:hypothetical protein